MKGEAIKMIMIKVHCKFYVFFDFYSSRICICCIYLANS